MTGTGYAMPDRPIRFVVFGASIVSEWDNPAATTLRAVLRALGARGHDVVFLEERGNRPTVELLRARGGSALRAFAARYPDLRYRTYELPVGLERTVWLGREVAIADAVIVQDVAPAGVVEVLAAFASPRIVRLLQVTGADVPAIAEQFDHVLTPHGVDASPNRIAFGPAVEAMPPQGWQREDGVVVAYDDTRDAHAAAALLADSRPTLVAPTKVIGPEWVYVPEVDLPERYGRARLMLPLAHGCPVVAVAAPTHPRRLPDLSVPVLRADELPAFVAAVPTGPAAALPERYAAATQAETLVGVVRSTLSARLTGHAGG